MKKILEKIFFIFFSLSLVSCGANYEADEKNYNQNGDEVEVEDQLIDTERKIIYTVSYTIRLEEIDETIGKIKEKAFELDGYIGKYSESESSAYYVYRIPTKDLFTFTSFIDSFDGTSSKELSTEDVTNEYNYIEAQITTLEASIAAYNKLLNEENLTMSEIIEIQNHIKELQVELTSISNNKASYDNKINYSTVTVNYYVKSTYKEPSFFESYFEYVGDFFVGFGKMILYMLPVLIVLGAIFSAIFFPIYFKHKK